MQHVCEQPVIHHRRGNPHAANHAKRSTKQSWHALGRWGNLPRPLARLAGRSAALGGPVEGNIKTRARHHTLAPAPRCLRACCRGLRRGPGPHARLAAARLPHPSRHGGRAHTRSLFDQLDAATCRCRRGLDWLGEHRAACPPSDVIPARGGPLECAARPEPESP